MSKPFLVGITGVIGAGKSLVGSLLQKRGFTVIDTDEVVHDLFATNVDLRNLIARRFGVEIVRQGFVDRENLGRMVFDSPGARKDLEAIVHPATLAETSLRIAQHSDHKVIFILVPLLFEAGLEDLYDDIWTVVVNDRKELVRRIASRNGMSTGDAEKRLAAQMPQEEKAKRATHVIDNSGTVEETDAQIGKLVERF